MTSIQTNSDSNCNFICIFQCGQFNIQVLSLKYMQYINTGMNLKLCNRVSSCTFVYTTAICGQVRIIRVSSCTRQHLAYSGVKMYHTAIALFGVKMYKAVNVLFDFKIYQEAFALFWCQDIPGNTRLISESRCTRQQKLYSV